MIRSLMFRVLWHQKFPNVAILGTKFRHSKRNYCRAKLLLKRDKNASGRVRLNIPDDKAPIFGILQRAHIYK